MNSKVSKWCVVPQCTNTSLKTPNKLFIYVPHDKSIRYKWLTLARRDPKVLSLNSSIYVCEDHFDLPNDMENYIQYRVMGSVSQVRMKRGCVPTKFECQPDRRKQLSDSTPRPYMKKKQRTLIQDSINALEESKLPTTNKNVDLGETSSVTVALGSYQIKQALSYYGKHVCRNGKYEIEVDIPSVLGTDEPPQSPPSPPVSAQEPLPPTCKACGKAFSGCIYECVQCEYRLCGACEQAGAHREHYVLRVPAHSSKEELERVLSNIRKALKNVEFEKPPAMRNKKLQLKPGEDSDEDSDNADDELPLEQEDIVEVKMELQVEEHDPFEDVPAASVKTEQADESFEDQRSATGQDAGTEREAIYGRVSGQSKAFVQVPSGSKPGLMSSTTYLETHGRVTFPNKAVIQEPSNSEQALKDGNTYLKIDGRNLVVQVPSVSEPAPMDSTSYSQVEVTEITIKKEPPDSEEPSALIVSLPASKRPADTPSGPEGTTRKGGRPKKSKPQPQM